MIDQDKATALMVLFKGDTSFIRILNFYPPLGNMLWRQTPAVDIPGEGKLNYALRCESRTCSQLHERQQRQFDDRVICWMRDLYYYRQLLLDSAVFFIVVRTRSNI